LNLSRIFRRADEPVRARTVEYDVGCRESGGRPVPKWSRVRKFDWSGKPLEDWLCAKTSIFIGSKRSNWVVMTAQIVEKACNETIEL
jgi:hypothetical protein